MKPVEVWWAALIGVSVFNLVAWALTARAHARRSRLDPAWGERRRALLWLAFVYTLGCAFRSWFPRADVQRICLYDGWISTVLVGRSVATVAELSFVAQWAILLAELARGVGARPAAVLAKVLVPLIAVAEVFSWYAVVTTSYVGNAVEESLWATSATLFCLGVASLWPRLDRRGRTFAVAALVAGIAYVAFMVTVDVPMYLTRWQADRAAGRAPLSLAEGFHDLATRWVPTREWDAWRDEIPWMSAYFSLAVWLSIGAVRLPRLDAAPPREP